MSLYSIKNALGKRFPKMVHYYLLLPGSNLPRLKTEFLSDSATHLIASARIQAQNILQAPVLGLIVDAEQRYIYNLAHNHFIKVNQFQRRGVHCFIGVRFLTLTLCYNNQLIAKASPKGITLFGDSDTQEIYGFTLVSLGYQASSKQSAIWHVMQAVTTTQMDGGNRLWQDLSSLPLESLNSVGFQNSPTAQTFKQGFNRREGHSLSYLNRAFAELTSDCQDSLRIDNKPEQMAKALLAYRDKSSVPWVFNVWLNAIEYRLGCSYLKSFPPEIHLSLTGLCNLECNFCSYTHDSSKHDFVTLEQIVQLEALKYIQVFRLHSGLGEPTTNPYLIDIVNYLSLHHPHISLNFFTNGLNLNRSGLIDALVGQVQWINVSLNAATRESWQEQCNLDRFERVQQNLKQLLAAKRSKGSLWPVVFGSMVLNKANLHELPLMPSLCRQLGIDRFTAIPFFAMGYDHPQKYGPSMALELCRQEYDAIYWETVQNARDCHISIELPLPTDQKSTQFGLEVRSVNDFANIEANQRPLDRFVNQFNFPQQDNSYCHFLWRQMAIGSTMKFSQAVDKTHYLYPCLGPLANLDLSPYTGFALGKDNNILDAWNNPIFTYLRQAQHQANICEVCDLCRQRDTRNPDEFSCLEQAIQRLQGTISEMYKSR